MQYLAKILQSDILILHFKIVLYLEMLNSWNNVCF